MSRWSFALLAEIAPDPMPGSKTITDHITEYQILLENPQSDAGKVAAKAKVIDEELARWEKAVLPWKGDPAILMKQIGRPPENCRWNWEEATQRYLALSALEQARYAANRDGRHESVQRELHHLVEKLALPKPSAGSRGFSDPRLLDHFAKMVNELEK